ERHRAEAPNHARRAERGPPAGVGQRARGCRGKGYAGLGGRSPLSRGAYRDRGVPLTKPPARAVRMDEMESTTPPTITKAASKRADVLLVDDDRFVLRAVQRMLIAGGYTVYAVDDPNAAMREALGGGYDVIVSDIHMPGLLGTELL